MRDYLSVSNLQKALMLSSVAVLMSVPRIILAGVDLRIYIPAAFAAMTFCAGAGTAWSHRAGMCGLFPARRKMLAGIGVAFILACIVTPVYLFCIDPIFQDALERTGSTSLLMLKYPATISGCLALALWSASFETMFFRVGAMSFFARLIPRQWIVLCLAVTLRVFVSVLQVADAGVVEAVPFFVIGSAIVSAMSCVLFARAGLPAAMFFSAGINLRLFIALFLVQ
ncbi:hypothetical protein ACFLS1_06795 [Verrucomicrobiota bacterium]